MKITVFTPYYLPGYKGGGPVKTIKNLFDSGAFEHVHFSLVTADRDLGDLCSYSSVTIGDWNRIGNANVFYATRGRMGFKQIRRIVKHHKQDFIYLNSFFSFRYSIYPQIWARHTGQTVVLAPRGEFSLGAFKLKLFKKWLFIIFYRLLGLHRNVIFQASSKYEYEDIQRVLGNVDIQVAENISSKVFAGSLPSKSPTTTRIVFISRITPKKNLLQAIEMLNDVANPVEYDIFGPIEDIVYWAKCEAAITNLPPQIKVKYKGLLIPEEVVKTMSKYDMFFMPTLGENYGHVIAEAFCAGLPVLITNTTPWRRLNEKGIGWDIPLSEPQRFAETIDEFATLTQEEYIAKREQILVWAIHKFSRSDSIDANLVLFKYAFERGRKQ